jgi:fructose-specific phosphotransferase system IIC component
VFSFLAKIAIVAAIVVGIYSVIYYRRTGELPGPLKAYSSQLNLPALSSLGKGLTAKLPQGDLGQNLSDTLDQLVTHSNTNSPIVLGVRVTNDSLQTLVEVLQNLPQDQFSQLKMAICATPSASPQ